MCSRKSKQGFQGGVQVLKKWNFVSQFAYQTKTFGAMKNTACIVLYLHEQKYFMLHKHEGRLDKKKWMVCTSSSITAKCQVTHTHTRSHSQRPSVQCQCRNACYFDWTQKATYRRIAYRGEKHCNVAQLV